MKQLFFALLLLVSLRAHAQPSTWTLALPVADLNGVMDVATGPDGNAYVTGYFSGSLRVGNTVLTSNLPGMCLYIAKLSPEGRVLRATKLEGATDAFVSGIAVDKAGNSYLSGRFYGTLTYNGGQTVSAPIRDFGGHSAILVKCGADGRVNWVVQGQGGAGGSLGDIEASDVAVDKAGNSYFCGRVSGNLRFGTLLLGPRKNQGFVASYNRQGQLRWARALQAYPTQASGFSASSLGALAVDDAGHCYLSGSGYGGWQLDGVAVQGLAGNVFLALLDARTGHLEWGKATPGEGDGNALTTDGMGDVYIGGSFPGTANFGGITLTSAGSTGSSDGFVARYDPDGSIDWATALGGPNIDGVTALAVDQKSRKVFVTGLLNFTSQATNRSFLATLNANGRMQQMDKVGGPGTSTGSKLALDDKNNIYTVGVFTGDCRFGPIGVHSMFTQSYFARFGSRMGHHRQNENDDNLTATELSLYPNPAQDQLVLRLPAQEQAGRATLYNQLGRAVAERPLPAAATQTEAIFDTSTLPDGLYTLRLATNQETTTRLVTVRH